MEEQRLPRRFRRALKPIRRIQWRYQRDRHGGPRWRLCAVGIADYDRRQTLGVMVAGVPSVGIACVGGRPQGLLFAQPRIATKEPAHGLDTAVDHELSVDELRDAEAC